MNTRCVWSVSNVEINFNEVESPELSTIQRFNSIGPHKKARKKGKEYKVETISLNDLLDLYDAPKVIDYLSIDTEGSEFEILDNFDFEKYQIRIITVEHAFTIYRDKIYDLLLTKGYDRKLESVSDFDDWYVLSDYASNI